MPERTQRLHPLLLLGDSDLDFVVKFVLASGSLKDMAQAYGVSYPTIRARLDRLIARLQEVLAERQPDPMANLLADLVGNAELSATVARRILDLHRQAKETDNGGTVV